MKKVFFAMIIASFVFVSCKHSHDHEEDHEHDHDCTEETQVSNEDAIHFELQQQEKIAFATDFPSVMPFGQVIKTTAQIQSAQADEALISARMAGIVLFSGNNWTEGQQVGWNQQMFVISGNNLSENNSSVRFTEAHNRFLKAESDYKRSQELAKEKIISEKDFLEIKTTYETAKSIYENRIYNFSAQGQEVSAPFSGYIRQIFVENGQYVEEGQALAAVSKNKSLILKADVQSKYAGLLPALVSATIRSKENKSCSLEDLNGRILSFGRSLSADNYMIPVSIQIDNKAGFIPGDFVEVYLKTRSQTPALTIPVSALTEEQGVYFVYVQRSPDTFEKREITVGVTDGIRIEVLSGLDKEDKVVVQGAISVKLAQSQGKVEAHTH